MMIRTSLFHWQSTGRIAIVQRLAAALLPQPGLHFRVGNATKSVWRLFTMLLNRITNPTEAKTPTKHSLFQGAAVACLLSAGQNGKARCCRLCARINFAGHNHGTTRQRLVILLTRIP
jgi:hypothetical protein